MTTKAAPESTITKFTKDVIAGTAGGFAICLVGHPFDTLKVRLQTQPQGEGRLYNGLVDCFKKTVQQDGIGGLYKGVASPLLGQMFFRAVMYSTYGQSQSFLLWLHQQGESDLSKKAKVQLTASDYFLAGGITGICATGIEGPIDLFKSQIQVQSRQAQSPGAVRYKGVIDCAKYIWSTRGIRGVYQGLDAVLLRNIPACSIYFGFNNLTRVGLATEEELATGAIPAWKLLAGGGAAGLGYWGLTYPFDVIKSAIQADHVDPAQRKYSGIVDCAKKLYAEGGIKRFSQGLSPCILRSVPANAVMWIVYEKTRSLLH